MKRVSRMVALLIAGSSACLASGALPFGSSSSAAAADLSKFPVRSLTCNVFGGPIVLDDTDFEVLAHVKDRGNNPPLTPQYFVRLKPTSTLR